MSPKANDQAARIDKLEAVIDTLGATFSSLKSKKKLTPVVKGPKFVFVPKVSSKIDTYSVWKEELRTMKEVPLLKELKEDPPVGKAKIPNFVPRSAAANIIVKSPLASGTIEIFDDIGDVIDFEET